MTLSVAEMNATHVPELCALLNHTIALGGTTAYETPFTVESFSDKFLKNPFCLSQLTALQGDKPVGFQVLFAEAPGMHDLLHIASFADQRQRIKGVGQLLFPQTRAAAQRLGAKEIEAKIRADNVPGLAYYTGLGFKEHSVEESVPLQSGHPVDRVITRMALA